MKTPLYRFQNFAEMDDTKQPETDEPNVYGEVVFKLGEIRHRFDGEVHSIWDGKACVFTRRLTSRSDH